MDEVTLPYQPRRIWANELHPNLDKFRFAVIVAHRRFGKTVGMVNQLIKAALTCEKISPQYAYLAPFRNQAKRIAWNYLKYYTAPILGLKVNETELYVELPSQVTGAVGARVYIVGGDKPDVLRGTYWDGIVLDEYAQMRPYLWTEIIRPAIADRKGFAYFIGTPKGQNAFYEIWQKALRRKATWYTYLSRVDESGVLDADEVDMMKDDMTETEIRQELYCDFTASASEVVIPIDLVTEAASRKLNEKDVPKGTPVILGVDIARFGDDRTCIFKRQGLWAEEPLIYKGLSVTDVVDRVIWAIQRWKPDMIFVDSGNMGAGAIDRLRQLGYGNIAEVAFGSKAGRTERYENIRAEMYFKLKAWLQAGGAIPDIPDLKTELSVTEYKFSKRSRIILEPKEQIKDKMGKSPDLADALALTFAREVAPRFIEGAGPQKDRKKLMCNTEYSVMEAVNKWVS